MDRYDVVEDVNELDLPFRFTPVNRYERSVGVDAKQMAKPDIVHGIVDIAVAAAFPLFSLESIFMVPTSLFMRYKSVTALLQG